MRRSCLASTTGDVRTNFCSRFEGAKKTCFRKSHLSSLGPRMSPQHCLLAVWSPFPGVHVHVVSVWLELSGFLGERFLCCSRGTERQDGWSGSGNAFMFFPPY